MSILNGLSFDIEDWFQVENLKEVISCNEWDGCDLRVIQNTKRILNLLEKNQTRATFFVLGWIAEKCPSLIKEIAAGGHEISSHGYGHELIYKLTQDEFHKDIKRSKEILESITSTPVLGYRAPSFSITPKSEWAIDVLKGLGFTYDSSIFPTSFHNRYGFNGISPLPFQFNNGLSEIPLSTYRFGGANFPLAGGGYFRLFPYVYFRRLSNIAYLLVTLKPSPSGALTMFSFETGTQGWASANWQSGAGVTSQTPNFHTDGNFGLQVDSAAGGWFCLNFPAPFDLTGKTRLKYDLQTLAAGTSRQVAMQVGDSWTWCEGGGWGWTNANTTTTIEIDLTSMSCGTQDLSKVQAMCVWFNGGGTFYIDKVSAE